jgi:hypothetical protein
MRPTLVASSLTTLRSCKACCMALPVAYRQCLRALPDRRHLTNCKLTDKPPLLNFSSPTSPCFLGPQVTPCYCVAEKSLATCYTMHRKSSSHRHTEISLPLQLIGQTSIQRCRRHVESGDVVQGNAMFLHPLTPVAPDTSCPFPSHRLMPS